MTLRKNILASYASQVYVVLIGIVMLPLYIRYMGAEAYGLVGFFTTLQVWFNLLDLGLTPTVAREAARHQSGALSSFDFRRVVRALEGVFTVLGVVGGVTLLLAADYIASHWLQASDLPQQEIRLAVQLMAITIALRWIGGLYRGVISGAQRLVWLSTFNIAVATARFAGVIPLLMYIGTEPHLFFSFQLGISLIELAVLLVYCHRLLPVVDTGLHSRWDWAPLKPTLKLAMSLAFTSSAGILMAQTDKLILSKVLPLSDYGYFSLAVLAASGIMLMSAPVSISIMPRMAKLEAEGDHAGLIRVYRQATQLVSVLAGSAAITLAFCAEPLLWAWTGSSDVASRAAPTLALYALGNGVMAVAAFPYYLQYAKGDMRLHLIGNVVFLLLLPPLIIWAASRHGAVGAGYAWLGMNLLALVAWLPLVHRKYQPGLNMKWYGQDIFVILLGALASATVIHLAWPASGDRWMQLAHVLATGIATTCAGGLSSSMMRGHALQIWRRWNQATPR